MRVCTWSAEVVVWLELTPARPFTRVLQLSYVHVSACFPLLSSCTITALQRCYGNTSHNTGNTWSRYHGSRKQIIHI